MVDTEEPEHGPDDALGRLGEVGQVEVERAHELPDELAANLGKGSGRLRRVLGLGQLALKLCGARAGRPKRHDQLGFGLRLHYASRLAAAGGPTGSVATRQANHTVNRATGNQVIRGISRGEKSLIGARGSAIEGP